MLRVELSKNIRSDSDFKRISIQKQSAGYDWFRSGTDCQQLRESVRAVNYLFHKTIS